MKNKNRNRYRATVLWIICICLFSCDNSTPVKTLKLAHGLDVSHPVHKAMEHLAEVVEEKSSGNLRVEIYPNGQLGQERELLELLQIGSLAMTKVSAAVMENFSADYKILSLPFLFRDREHAFKVLDHDIGRQLLLSSENVLLRGLCFYDAGSRSFYTEKVPVRSPEDLAGLKIRVQKSKTAVEMVTALGGSPTPISWGELYTALQQGVVDGAENNPPSFYLSHHYEVCKYYSLDEHTFLPDVLLIGTQVWNRLNQEEKGWIDEAALESSQYQRKLWAEAEKEALQAVQKAGVQIIRPDKRPFESKVEGIYASYKDQPELFNMIQQIKAIH